MGDLTRAKPLCDAQSAEEGGRKMEIR